MTKEFKNPAATATMIVQNENFEILLVKRKHPPFKDMWALPGGFLNYGKETLEQTAVRELKEETCLETTIKDITLLRVASNPDRDPRGHVIDHIYVIQKYSGTAKAADDAKEIKWFSLDNLPPIAFDHMDSIKKYMAQGYYARDKM